MSKVLFRAKQIDSGEWVEGYYVHYDDIKDNGKGDCDYIVQKHNGVQFPFVQVIPETVGRYTGLTDVNGNKIFEGDIHCNENNNKKFVVKFGHFYDEELLDDMYGWYMEDNWSNRFGLNGSEYEYANIIGNTIDNPKLMGE